MGPHSIAASAARPERCPLLRASLPFALRQIKPRPAQTLMISLLHRTASSKTRATPSIRQPKSRTGGVALFAVQREAAPDRHLIGLRRFSISFCRT